VALDRADDPVLRRIAFSKEQLREIRYAALLHDFGKVGVREHVLRKEKKLHHADMRLLEQRFRYARACMERQAYHTLAQRHLEEGWSAAGSAARRTASRRSGGGSRAARRLPGHDPQRQRARQSRAAARCPTCATSSTTPATTRTACRCRCWRNTRWPR
jgi:hypothetical protein